VWRPFELATLSFGYGLSVTQIQLAQAYSIIAAHGQKRPITFLKQSHPVAGTTVISPEVMRQLSAMLHSVTEAGGSGTRARIPGYEVAGKTGTVKKIGDSGYSTNHYLSLFGGYAPFENPRLVAVIMIDDPSGSRYYGGEIAAPVFSRVMGEALRILNVPIPPPQKKES
jgi:cell division protein FtsI (penicillin-binding protein 3)